MPDWGFVGPSYEAPSIYQSADETINFFCEKDPYKADGQRGQYSLYPTPGLVLKCQPTNGEVRGMRPIQGGTVLVAIIGSTFYTINQSFVATARGTLGTSTGPITIGDNGSSVYFCDGPNRYFYTYGSATFGTVSGADGGFTGGGATDVIDGFLVYNQPGTQNWGATSLNSVASPALSVGKKDGSSDNLVTLIVNNREVFLLGEFTSEVWQDAGAFPFPFTRIPGTSTQHGLAAKNSVSRLGNSFAYVSQDTRGQGIIVVMNGYTPVEISTHAVTNTLINQTISDAVAWTYQMEGHEFYVVTFPSIDLTWVYDASTQFWHKWLYWDPMGVYHRHRGQCQAIFNGLVLVGDYQNGAIYAIDNKTYTDNGQTIRRLRRAPHLVTDFNQQYFEMLQLQFQPGTGLSTGQGADPQAMLRWSNDGGSTWSNEHWRSIGQIGKYKNRVIWRRLGTARDRVFEVVFSDPVKAVIVSANLKANAGDN
jgi:hypothetical protein